MGILLVTTTTALLSPTHAARHAEPPSNPTPGLLQAVPELVWRSPEDVQQDWALVKAIDDPSKQLALLHASNLPHTACTGLVNFRFVAATRDLPIRWRDDRRGRTWLHPATAKTLTRALGKLHQELPGTRLTLGDMSQIGCGQLAYGELVSEVVDRPRRREASALLQKSLLTLGRVSASTFERSRKGVVWQEQTLVGRDTLPGGDLRLRVVTRRYTQSLTGSDRSARRRLKRSTRGITQIARIDLRRITHHEAGRTTRFWRTHLLSRKQGRQWVVFSSQKIDADRPLEDQIDHIQEFRISRWLAKKPLSFKGEERWKREAPQGGRRWHAWKMMHEAGHESHIAGRDLDVSYVTQGNSRHFNARPNLLRRGRNITWLRLLQEASEELDTHLGAVLLGPRVFKKLHARAQRKKLDATLFERFVHVVEGHDGHHHLRMSAPASHRITFLPWRWRVQEPFSSLFDVGLYRKQ